MSLSPYADLGWRVDRYNGSFARNCCTKIAGRQGTVLGTVGGQQLNSWRETFQILSNFDTVRWPNGRRRRFAKGRPRSQNGPEIHDFRPVFCWELGWRWVPDDARRTAFVHTAGHTAADANVCLLGTRRDTSPVTTRITRSSGRSAAWASRTSRRPARHPRGLTYHLVPSPPSPASAPSSRTSSSAIPRRHRAGEFCEGTTAVVAAIPRNAPCFGGFDRRRWGVGGRLSTGSCCDGRRMTERVAHRPSYTRHRLLVSPRPADCSRGSSSRRRRSSRRGTPSRA